MAHINPKRKGGPKDDKYEYIVTGVVYRCKLVVWDESKLEFTESDDLRILVWSLEQSYHSNTPYSMHGDLRYHGISLKEAWEEIQSLVGKCDIPETLQELQPWKTQQL